MVAMGFAGRPVAISLLFWFTTAPGPRFAEGTIWILAVGVAYLPFASRDSAERFARAIFLVAVSGLTTLELATGFARLRKETERLPNFVGTPPVLTKELTYSGLAVWVPVDGESAGPWQIPATPPDRFDPRLELRGKSFREGFRMNFSWPKPKWKNGRMVPASEE
jgi:hypothetical protein